MADDAWGSWNPTTNPSVRGMEAYQARRALSTGLSVDPQAAAPPFRKMPSSTSGFTPVAGPSSSPVRRPLPEQSFPGGGRGGPYRSSGAGWQRSPPRTGHIDHGWASRIGHEEPIAKPSMVGDIESATNAPLTEGQLLEMQNSGRSGRNDMQDIVKRRLDDEKKQLDSSRYSPRESRRARSRDRESTRERERDRDRDKDSDRERDRKRSRTDEDRERRRQRERSRSRSRDRDRREERRERRRDDERRERRRDDKDAVRERRRSRSPRRDRHSGADRRRERRVDVDDQETRSARTEAESKKASQVDADATEAALQHKGERRNSDDHSGNYAIVISGVRDGTTTGDMYAILEDYGQLIYCKKFKDADSPESTIAFEAGFQDLDSAEKAVRDLDGMHADGCKLKTRLLPRVKQEEEEDESMHPDSPELKLKGFAASINKDTSLLSRLGAPIKETPDSVNGEAQSNGSATKLPSKLLAPYEELLSRAGVDSLDTLRKLVRPGTVKEYIEMLCKEYPDEELLQGLTARWALKERLEEWLGEKEPLKMGWQYRCVAA